MKTLQILGTGCAKCTELARLADHVAKELALEYRLEKITDLAAIAKMGVFTTPALAVDGKVLVKGRLPTADEVKKLLASA